MAAYRWVYESRHLQAYRLRNDLYCVEWGVKLYSNQPTNQPTAKNRDQLRNPTLGNRVRATFFSSIAIVTLMSPKYKDSAIQKLKH